MKNCILFVILPFIVSAIQPALKYWENLNYDEQNVIIAKIKSSNDIVSYYVKNNYIVNDYNQMDSLLNALTKAQNENDKKCLYFHLFNEIAIKSDGDLAELVCEYIEPMLLSDVDYVLPYIMCHKEYYTLYTSMLAGHIYFEGENYDDSIRLFDKFRLKFTSKSINVQKLISTFCAGVKSSISEIWND